MCGKSQSDRCKEATGWNALPKVGEEVYVSVRSLCTIIRVFIFVILLESGDVIRALHKGKSLGGAYWLESPSFLMLGTNGAGISLLSNMFQSTSTNHGCVKISELPRSRFP